MRDVRVVVSIPDNKNSSWLLSDTDGAVDLGVAMAVMVCRNAF